MSVTNFGIDNKEWFDGKPRVRYVWVPYNAKIADITHADVNKHTLDLAAALPETRNIIMVSLHAHRIAGTGLLDFYPNEGAHPSYTGDNYAGTNTILIEYGSQRLQYDLTVANDDWDLYCLGYVVEV